MRLRRMYLNSELEVEAVASEALADLNMILSRDIVAALELGKRHP